MVVSLWQVNDGSTSMIMNFFYKNLKKGLNKAEALRQAKLAYIKDSRGITGHPALWSPFIQLGNKNAITIKKTLDLKILLLGVAKLSLYIRYPAPRKNTK